MEVGGGRWRGRGFEGGGGSGCWGNAVVTAAAEVVENPDDAAEYSGNGEEPCICHVQLAANSGPFSVALSCIHLEPNNQSMTRVISDFIIMLTLHKQH